MAGSPQSAHSFILPGESDAIDQSLQLHSSLDVPAGSHNEGSSSSKVDYSSKYMWDAGWMAVVVG